MKITYTILFAVLACAACAQTNHRVLAFNKGEEFTKVVSTRSNCVLQRGAQSLSITSHSSLQKTYTITNAATDNFSMDVTVNNIADTIDAMGQQLAYNTNAAPDPASYIQKSLKAMTGNATRLVVNKAGFVSSVSYGGPQVYNDSVVSFAGLQPEQFVKGSSTGLTADFPYNPALKKGYSWTDSSHANNRRTITTFTIEGVNEATTSISFTTSIFDTYLNTSINGALVLDNYSGVIVSRLMQSVSTGYEQVNGAVYSVTRRSAVTESCYKKQ